jgi:thymidylate synthase
MTKNIVSKGDLPVLVARGKNIPEAWENSVCELYDHGLWYKRGGTKDKGKMQTDSTMITVIEQPWLGPFLHKRMCCGVDDLFEYQMELLGAKNSWVDPTDRTTRWEYHYHERFAGHPGEGESVNQLEEIERLMHERPTTRRMNMITWAPSRDYSSQDPPCLQRVWFALVPNQQDGSWTLNTNYDFRTRNVMIAAPMNQVGLVTLAYDLKEKLNEGGMKVQMGRVVDKSDSYHVSSKDQDNFHKFIQALREGSLKSLPIEEKTIGFEDTIMLMEIGRQGIEQKLLGQTRKCLEEDLPPSKVDSAFERERGKILGISQRVMYLNNQMLKESQNT